MLFFRKKNKKHKIYLYEKTHIGGRDENQDCCGKALLEDEGKYCFVVADGLGGHTGGRQAAQLAVKTITSHFCDISENNIHVTMENLILGAHDEILRQRENDNFLGSMKSTCVVLIIINGKAYWGTVGDSRLYWFRNGEIIFKSKDHSVVQMLLDLGEITSDEASQHPDRNTVLKSLGTSAELVPSIQADGLEIFSGDYFLLCTDGLWEYFTDRNLCNFFNNNVPERGKDTIDKLFIETVEMANKTKEKFDNITAQLVVVK